jgi:hypothetical protein
MMSFKRTLKRKYLKKQWKELKKTSPELRKLSYADFSRLWERSMIQAAKEEEVAKALSTEQEDMLSDMFVEEIDEDTVTE